MNAEGQPGDYRPLLEQALHALRDMRAELEAVTQARAESIAILGMGCRLPGGVTTPEAFWQLLRAGRDTVGAIPPSRWDSAAYYDPDPNALGKMYVRSGSFLEDIEQFDAAFFEMSPREASSLDPQQRLLLEVSWEALEHAGVAPDQLAGSQTGVFVGAFWDDYSPTRFYGADPRQIDGYSVLSHLRGLMAGRLAYVLGVHGPTLQVDTACSSSLLAVHLACQALRARECHLALAGGVNLILAPEMTLGLCRMQALAPDGLCKAFDARADGFGRGEGCGMVVLKRLSDALTDGDPILALIRGSAVNHDGRSNGLTAPNGASQEALLRQALSHAGLAPEEIHYVEAHGTGTPLGDPIEVLALGKVLGQARQAPLVIGSVKSNIGHLDAAAGVAGLMKVVLALQHGEIPPHVHFTEPNPHIPWQQLAITVPTQLMPWSAAPRRAGISAFGMSGTNVHVIVEEPPTAPAVAPITRRPLHLLCLSAKSAAALRALADRYATSLAMHPDISLEDVCFTAHTGRAHFDHRLALAGASPKELSEQLAAIVQGPPPHGGVSGHSTQRQRPKIAFLFTGQGSQYTAMGRQLYETQPTFRRTLERCDAILQPYLDVSLLDVLYAEPGAGCLEQTAYTQPALCALEYALAELWQSWGITPHAVLGHSVGEYVAACVAGVFRLEEALQLVAARGRLMQTLPQEGEMVAVWADEEQVAAALAPYADAVSVAAINGPQSVVIAGQRQAVWAVVAALTAAGIATQQLTVSHAFHSPCMEPILAEFAHMARQVHYAAPQIDLIANLTGQRADAAVTTPEYWVRHVRQPVRFAAGMETLQALGCEVFIEIGPQPVLLGLGRQCLAAPAPVSPLSQTPASPSYAWLPSLRRGQADWQQLLSSLGALYVRGVDVNWASFHRDYARRKVVLPAYPFQRQRFWMPHTVPASPPPVSLRPLVDTMTTSPLLKEAIFETQLSTARQPFLADHRVYGEVVVAGACHVAMVLSAADLLGHGQAYELADVIFPAALVVPETTTLTAQLVLTPEEGLRPAPTQSRQQAPSPEARTAFRLISLSGTRTAETPVTHAAGTIVTLAGASPARMSLAALQERCQKEMTSAALYAAAHAQQVELGPSFRCIDAVWQGEGEALGRLRLPEALDSIAGYVLHPGLLDACFRLASATLVENAAEATLLPVGMASLRVYPSTSSHTWWCYARQVEALQWDLHLLDPLGQVMAEVRGFEMRRAPLQAVRSTEPWRQWLYQVTWQPQALPPDHDRSSAQGQEAVQADTATRQRALPWLIFADTLGIGETLAGLLRQHGIVPILVTRGPRYQQVEARHYVIDPDAPADYQQLLQACAGLEGIVHLWSLDDNPVTTAEEVMEAAQRGCASTLQLVRALGQDAPPLAVVCLVTRGAQAVSAPDGVEGFAQSPLWGMGKVMRWEYPALPCLQVDVDAHASVAEAAQALCADLTAVLSSARMPENQVAWRDNRRYVARLVRYQPAEADRSPGAIRADGTYLITGGMGGVGLLVARWLVEQGARHLLLMGRREPDALARRQVAALTQTGANVIMAQADVTQMAQVAGVLQRIDAAQPLRGIIHAAAVLDDGILQQQTWQRFAPVLAPKVQGTWNLHLLTKDLPLDFFVLCSSAASVLGQGGQAGYAAANAFLDALAHYRQAQNLPALSINWGAWAEVGLAAGLGHRLQAQGLEMLAPQEGLQALASLLAQPPHVPQVGVLPINWSLYRQQLPLPQALAFLSEVLPQERVPAPGPVAQTPSWLERVAQAAPDARHAVLHTYVEHTVARVLGRTPAQSATSEPTLLELGLDSLLVFELRNHVQRELKVTLPMERLLQNPTIRRLVELLLDRLDGPSAPPTAAPQTLQAAPQQEPQTLYNSATKIKQLHATVTAQDGRKVRIGGRWVYDFASCNYLGLDLHPAVMQAIPPALEKWGVHPSWSRTVASPAIYDELEHAIAQLVGAPTVLVFPALTLLHMGVIPVLAGDDGVIFKDIAAHRSIHDACRLAQTNGAACIEFRHSDAIDLEHKLAQYPLARTKIIATDGVYSVSGAYPPLVAYARLAKAYNASLYIDDAHGIGVVGEHPSAAMAYGYKGNGIVQHCGLDYAADDIIYVAGLSKAFSSYGAFVTCADNAMKDRFKTATPYIFSGPSPVASLASALAGLQVNQQEGDQQRQQIYYLTQKFVTAVTALGFAVDNAHFFPIVGVLIGQASDVIEACKILWDYGILITPFLFPAVAMDRGLVRFSITAANTEAEVDQAIKALQAVWSMLHG